MSLDSLNGVHEDGDGPHFYFRDIQRLGGFNRMIMDGTPNGTSAVQSMILELGGGSDARNFGEQELRDRHITVANVDCRPTNYGDHVFQYDLEEFDGELPVQLKEMLASDRFRLGSAVVSHLASFLRKETMSALLRNTVSCMQEGSALFLTDKIKWQYDLHPALAERQLAAFQAITQLTEQDVRLRLERLLIGPSVSDKTHHALCRKGKNNHKIMMPLVEEGKARIRSIPLTEEPTRRPIPLQDGSWFYRDLAEQLFILRRVDPAQEAMAAMARKK